MLTLMLLRHAKSSKDDPALADIDRPINQQGRDAAHAMGAAMAARKLAPSRILCSPSLRTRQTWDIVRDFLKPAFAADFIHDIYDHDDAAKLLGVIQTHGGTSTPLMLVGHNPSFERLARTLIRSGDSMLRKKLERKFPTAALAIIEFEASDWRSIGQDQGILKQFIRPKALI